MSRIRVVHIINSFQLGGAETMLCNLLLRTDLTRFEPSIISLIDDMTLAGPAQKANVPITVIGMKPGVPDPRGLLRTARTLRRLQPDIVQTWMDHSNLIGGLAARMATGAPVVWGVHHGHHIPGVAKRMTRFTVWTCAQLSRLLPSRIVLCSEESRRLYTANGFAAERLTVIPNGFDTVKFHPDEDARISVRRELNVDPQAVLIGFLARFDPNKDHSNFIRAAAQLAAQHNNVHFVLCGHRVDNDNSALTGQIAELGLTDRFHLLGARSDAPRIQASLDIASTSSFSEAFPMTIGEAMSCGVPFVATDVGDSARIIDTAGRVVPPRDPVALANAWNELVSMGRAGRLQLGQAARKRICALFALEAVTRQYEAVYDELLAERSIIHSPPSSGPVPGFSAGSSSPARPLRVLMVVESSAGGTGRHVMDLTQGLLDRGCDVHLVHSTRRIDGTFLYRLDQFKSLPGMSFPIHTGPHPRDWSIVRAIRRYMRDHGPFDAIHGHSSKGGALARLASIGTGVPAFYTIHGLILTDPKMPRLSWTFYWSIELFLSLFTSRIIAVSPEELRAAVQLGYGRSRVTLVPNGIGPTPLTPREQARKDLGLDSEKFVIGFVGRLVDQKAPQVLISAFASVAAAVDNARLALVGSGPLQDALQLQARQLGVAEKILWLGERSASAVMAAFDVFAISSRREGLPYVVLEAMAAGLPIVATASSGIESLVEPQLNGLVVPPDDAGALANALIALAADPQQVQRFGRLSRQRASKFTIDAMVRQTLATYLSAAQDEPMALPA